jgi:pimeloyl-ACP methyl ester carboxylesterase
MTMNNDNRNPDANRNPLTGAPMGTGIGVVVGGAATRRVTLDATVEEQAQARSSSADASVEPRLPPALGGERIVFGGVNCYAAGNGPPLVLVHSINAAPSAAEMRPIYEHCRATHTVFAIDLPGFGLSERSDCHYDPRLMTDTLHALAEQVRMRCGAVPIDALASSLGCEFLARAAVEQPTRWGRLAFVSPTGLNGTKARRGPPGSTRAMPWLHALLSANLWSQSLYRLLTRPAVIRYFLQRTWGRKSIDETLWAYNVLTARQPGARFAPLHFLSGSLFSNDIHSIYEAVSQPVWMSHGVRGDFKDFRGKRVVHDRGNWHTTVYQTGALPYFEMQSAFLREFDAFLTVKDSGRSADTPVPAREEATSN